MGHLEKSGAAAESLDSGSARLHARGAVLQPPEVLILQDRQYELLVLVQILLNQLSGDDGAGSPCGGRSRNLGMRGICPTIVRVWGGGRRRRESLRRARAIRSGCRERPHHPGRDRNYGPTFTPVLRRSRSAPYHPLHSSRTRGRQARSHPSRLTANHWPGNDPRLRQFSLGGFSLGNAKEEATTRVGMWRRRRLGRAGVRRLIELIED